MESCAWALKLSIFLGTRDGEQNLPPASSRKVWVVRSVKAYTGSNYFGASREIAIPIQLAWSFSQVKCVP